MQSFSLLLLLLLAKNILKSVCDLAYFCLNGETKVPTINGEVKQINKFHM